MLTKNDLQKIKQAIKDVAVTKDEAKSFATKDDLKYFATKDDLKNFATKDDLTSLSTKDDLKKLEKKLDTKFTQLFDVIDKDVMETKGKIKTIEQSLRIPAIS